MKAWRAILSPLLVLLLLAALSHSQEKFYRVKRVVDGDTLLLTNGERVRLIGVDTPEIHESKKLYRDAERTGRDIKTITAMGQKASAFTKSLVDRKEVRLEYDQANAHISHRDKYGRIPAYGLPEGWDFAERRDYQAGVRVRLYSLSAQVHGRVQEI